MAATSQAAEWVAEWAAETLMTTSLEVEAVMVVSPGTKGLAEVSDA